VRPNTFDPASPRLVGTREAWRAYGGCLRAFRNAVKDGTFPPAIKVGRSTRWLSTEIEAWLAAAAASRKATWPPAPAAL
jgi:predicted DNA-binding transcriptional regulator AlpA